jgi:hypothetical protein
LIDASNTYLCPYPFISELISVDQGGSRE